MMKIYLLTFIILDYLVNFSSSHLRYHYMQRKREPQVRLPELICLLSPDFLKRGN
jgi:hypothetical protein